MSETDMRVWSTLERIEFLKRRIKERREGADALVTQAFGKAEHVARALLESAKVETAKADGELVALNVLFNLDLKI